MACTLIAAMSLAAGTWVALHPRSAPPPAPSTSASVAPLPPPVSSAVESPALPPSTSEAVSVAPWPRLNPEASLAKAWRIADGPHHRAGDRQRIVTFTFDDGPFPETTPKVLDLLAKHDVKATFFVIGRYLDGEGERAVASRDALKKIAAAGHLIGNHTHDHSLLTNITHNQVLDQIDRGASSIERVIGKKPLLIRPPYGQLDEFGQAAVRDRGLDILLWNIEVQDMERDDERAMYTELLHQIVVKEGGVVLLHDIRWSSIHVLERLLDYLAAKRWDPAHPSRAGYTIVDMPTYLREIEASPPQHRARARKK